MSATRNISVSDLATLRELYEATMCDPIDDGPREHDEWYVNTDSQDREVLVLTNDGDAVARVYGHVMHAPAFSRARYIAVSHESFPALLAMAEECLRLRAAAEPDDSVPWSEVAQQIENPPEPTPALRRALSRAAAEPEAKDEPRPPAPDVVACKHFKAALLHTAVLTDKGWVCARCAP